MSPAAKASFWFVVSNVTLKGISFITTPIFTRLLDVADYGISSVFVTWEGVISIFATLSLAGGVYNVAMTKYEKDIETLTSSLIGLSALSSILVYVVCIGINAIFPQLFGLSIGYLVFMWIQTFTNVSTTFWLMRKRYTYDYKKVIAYNKHVKKFKHDTTTLEKIYLDYLYHQNIQEYYLLSLKSLSKYMTYMPTEEELSKVINEEKRLIEEYKISNK